MEIALKLPWPPTANSYWRHNRGRTHISKAGQAFRDNVLAVVWADLGKIEPMTGLLAVSVRLSPPDERKRDIDNLQKPLLDAMEYAGVYRNDNQVSELHTYRDDPERLGGVSVEVWQLVPPPGEEGGENKHPLAELVEFTRTLVAADQTLGGRAHAQHMRTASQSIRSLLPRIRHSADRIEADIISGRYNPLADP